MPFQLVKFSRIAAVLLTGTLGTLEVLGEPGDLDYPFGNAGRATVPQQFPAQDQAQAVALQSDGKFVAAGFRTLFGEFDFELIRYGSDGLLDTSFGTAGRVLTDFGSDYDLAQSVAIQADGKIVVAGQTGSTDFAVARYGPDGTLDSGFGSGGKVITDFNGGDDVAYSLAILPGGKILVAGVTQSDSTPATDGFELARYDSSGALDSTFGVGGKAVIGTGQLLRLSRCTLLVQSDGKLIVVGTGGDGTSAHSNVTLVRCGSNGAPDPTFGGGTGLVQTGVAVGRKDSGAALQGDGRILVVQTVTGGSMGADVALFRYLTDGTLDPSFGSGGSVQTDIGGEDDFGQDVAVQPDGKIVVAATSMNGRDPDFALVRYSADGTLDSGFGEGGTVTTDIDSSDDVVTGVVLQSDGKIAVVGRSTSGDYFPVLRYLGGEPPTVTVDSVLDTKTSGVAGEPSGTMFVEFGAPAIDDGKVGGIAKISAGTQTETVIFGGDGTVQARVGGFDSAGGQLVSLDEPVFGGEALGFPGVAAQGSVSALPLRALLDLEWTRAARPGGKVAALYSRLSRAGGIQRLVGQTDPAPGGGQFAKFGRFGLPRTRGGLIYTATLHPGGGVTPANNFGIWRQQAGGNGSDLLLRNGTPVQLVSGPTRTVKKLTIMAPVANATDQRRSFAPDGGVAALATFADGGRGVVRVAPDGSVDVPVEMTSAVPDAAEQEEQYVQFTEMRTPAIGSGGRYALLAALKEQQSPFPDPNRPKTPSRAVFARQDGNLRRVLGIGESVPGGKGTRFSKLGDPSIGQSGMVGLIAALTGSAVRSPARQAIVRVDGRIHDVVARLGQHAAGLGEGVVYKRFISVVLTDTVPARLVFTATVAGPGVMPADNLGLWSVSNSTGTNLVLRNGTAIPVGGENLTLRTLDALQAPPKSIGQGRSTDASGFVTAKVKLSDGRKGVLRIPLP